MLGPAKKHAINIQPDTHGIDQRAGQSEWREPQPERAIDMRAVLDIAGIGLDHIHPHGVAFERGQNGVRVQEWWGGLVHPEPRQDRAIGRVMPGRPKAGQQRTNNQQKQRREVTGPGRNGVPQA